jgi:hypothetical protein
MKIGFTGTRRGMTHQQDDALQHILEENWRKDLGVREWHDGDCIGADAEARDVVSTFPGVYIHSHPCNLSNQRAYSECDVDYEELPPLVRNKIIVDSVDLMIATPGETTEQFRGSGTWATIRYARKTNTTLMIVWPDGSISREN